MQSLQQFDCLPRLVDALVSKQALELHFARSWNGARGATRLQAEELLGHRPEQLRLRWQSQEKKGMDKKYLFQVTRGR